jgi:hypothetical protein
MIIILLIIFLLLPLTIWSTCTEYYASSNGTGSTCSTLNPCSLNTATNSAMPGDRVILKDGTFVQMFKTVRNGLEGSPITFVAEHSRQAIIKWPLSTAEQLQNVAIRHDWIIMRGIVSDGNNLAKDTIRIGNDHNDYAEHVILEDFVSRNGGAAGLNIHDAKHIIVRWGTIQNTGNHVFTTPGGSSIYTGSCCHNGSITNDVQIYGLFMTGHRNNSIDLKEGTSFTNFHHNIVENFTDPINENGFDGVVRGSPLDASVVIDPVRPTNHQVKNNVFRNGNNCNYLIRTQRKTAVENNVWYNITNCGSVSIDSRTTTDSVVNGNVSCDPVPSTEQRNLGSNLYHRPQSECDAQVTRIMNERNSLPAIGSGYN